LGVIMNSSCSKPFVAAIGFAVLASCAPALKNTVYDYSYITSYGAHASRSEFPGQLYVLTLHDGSASVYEVDGRVDIPESDYRTRGATSGGSSLVRGARADLVQFGEDTISGGMEFAATITSDNTSVRRVTASTASDLVENLYTAISRQGFLVGSEPIAAREVVDGSDVYYAFVSGVGSANSFELRHGAPEGVTNGFSVNIDGQQVTGVTITSRNTWTCKVPDGASVDANTGSCLITIEILDAAWTQTDGELRLNVFPAREDVDRTLLAEAFRARN
jgi:hypothetical protein